MKIKKLAIFTIPLVPLCLFGCGEKSKCKIKETHVHVYNRDGYNTYIDSEIYKTWDGYNWTSDLMYVQQSDLKLYEFLYKEELLKIEDNEETLRRLFASLDPIVYYERTVKTTNMKHFPGFDSWYYIDVSPLKSEWAEYEGIEKISKYEKITGRIREAILTLNCYKIIDNGDGTYSTEESEPVDNIEDMLLIKDEYPYFSLDLGSKLTRTGMINEDGTITYDEQAVEKPKELVKED